MQVRHSRFSGTATRTSCMDRLSKSKKMRTRSIPPPSSLLLLVSLASPSARCTIYTAVYKDQPVVVKLMRKDVQDATLVRDELELELALLRR